MRMDTVQTPRSDGIFAGSILGQPTLRLDVNDSSPISCSSASMPSLACAGLDRRGSIQPIDSSARQEELLRSVMAAAAEPGTPKLNRSWRNTPPLISTAAAPCTEASKTLTRQATPISNKTPTIEPLGYQFQLSFKRFMSSGAHGYEESRACSPEESRSSTPTTSYFPSHASCNSLNSLSSLAASPTLGPADAPMPLTLSHSAAFGSELLLPAPLLRGRSATSMQLPLPYEEPMQYEELLPSPKPRLVREVLPCATPAQKLIVLPGSDPALPKIAPLTSGCADGLVLLSCTATLIQKVEAASISDAPWPKRVKYA